jgi:hypothetical protein
LGARAQCKHGEGEGGRGVKGRGRWAGGTDGRGGDKGTRDITSVLRQRSPNVNFALQEKWVRAGKERAWHAFAGFAGNSQFGRD